MIRFTTLACAALVLLLPLDSSRAASDPAHNVSCKVVLPKAAVPEDPGFFITMEEVTVASREGHRLFHEPVAYYYVVRGTGSMSIDGKPDVPLAPGTVVLVPSRAMHQVHNASDNAPLVFMVTLVESSQEQVLTAFVGSPDMNQGCPHKIQ